MADPTKRQAQPTPEDGEPSTQQKIPPADEDPMQRSAESGEGEVPDVAPEQERLEEDLPSNRAQERGGP